MNKFDLYRHKNVFYYFTSDSGLIIDCITVIERMFAIQLPQERIRRTYRIARETAQF